MAYTKTTWVNGGTPAINATNLGKIETGLFDLDADLTTLDIKTQIQLAKTNFKIDAHTNATKNDLSQLVVNILNDSDGINDSLSSGYYYDSVNKNLEVTFNGIDSYTKLLLHCDGVNGESSFPDSSGTGKSINGSIASYTVTSTTQKKFGTASALFDEASDTLRIGDSADFDFGSGEFTIDFWYYPTSLPNNGYNAALYNQYTDANNYIRLVINNTGGTYYLAFIAKSSGSSVVNVSVALSAFAINNWYNVEVCRSGNNIMFFLNGVKQGSNQAFSGTLPNLADNVNVGYWGYGLNDTTPYGYFDEYRVSKGVARHTANFTPMAEAYSATSRDTVPAIVLWDSDTAISVPTQGFVYVEETINAGTITYYISRDNGTTFTQLTKNTFTNISAQPSGTTIVFKAVLTADAELTSIAWGWK